MIDLAIVNAKVYTESGVVEGGIAIDQGKICFIGSEGKLPRASETVDVRGNLVLPGLIDIHTHMRGLGLKHKEDFYSGTCAALAGGFTTVLDMPNTLPPTDSAQRLKEKIELAERMSVANIGFYSSLPSVAEEARSINELGAVGFKLFLNNPLTEVDIENDEAFIRVLDLMRELDSILAVHAEDRRLIDELEKRFKAGAEQSPLIHSKTHPPTAEVRAVNRVIHLSSGVNPRLHFCHISTGRASSLIAGAKAERLRVTYEVTPHHLLLSGETLKRLKGIAFVDPPLRSLWTARRLWNDLVGGRIDVVASDHAPHSLEEKLCEDFWKVPSGFPGLETTLPLLMTMVNNGRLSLSRLVEVLAQNPSKIFRLVGKGVLDVGFDADLTVVDTEMEFVIDSSEFHSKARYSPFDGWRVTGKPVQVFLSGELVMEDGEILSKPGSGSVIRPNV